MSVFNPIKVIDKNSLVRNDSANVSIGFSASPDTNKIPTDIVIVLDESSSMRGIRFDKAKSGILDLVNLIISSSGSSGTLYNTRIGIVLFSTTAEVYVDLTSDIDLLISSINNIKEPGGKTNHYDAFVKAGEMFDVFNNKKIVVMFTDGFSNGVVDANVPASELKNDGVEIFCLGYGRVDTRINLWASEPTNEHVSTTTDVNDIEKLFRNVAYDIIGVGARNVLINEVINSDLNISRIVSVYPGTANIIDNNTIIWSIDVIGSTDKEKALLVFEVNYNGNDNKSINVNDSITYSDYDNNSLVFPNPRIYIEGNNNVIINEDNNITSAIIEECKDSFIINSNDILINDLGRIVEVSIPIKKVCPNKRFSLGIILSEIDINNIEHVRGTKTILINPIVSDKCEDVFIKCVNFVVPEEVDTSGNINSICNTRSFRVRVFINYIDNNFICCDNSTVIIK